MKSPRRLFAKVGAGISPLLPAAMLIFGMPYALGASHALYRAIALIFVCSLLLTASAVIVARELFQFRAALPLLAAGMVVVYGGWIWQRIAFIFLIPNRFLQYGFFLTDPGKRPRFLVLELPFGTITALLGVGFVASVVVANRHGARWWSNFVLLAWWLTAFLVFAMPSLNLYLQGDAAIFI